MKKRRWYSAKEIMRNKKFLMKFPKELRKKLREVLWKKNIE